MRKITQAKATAPLLILCVLALAPAAAAGYTVKPACAAPAPGYAACMALRLVPSKQTPSAQTPSTKAPAGAAARPSATAIPAAPTPSASGLSPEQLHTAYELPLESSASQTIAIVDAYDDPNAEADLGVYDEQFELPACTQGNGCFTKVNQQGLSAPLPAVNGEWAVEISTDIQVAHAVCQNCKIVLVEAKSASFVNLETAETAAAVLVQAASPPGTTTGEISNSWGGPEPPLDTPAFNHPGIVITASAGDDGYLNWDEYSSRLQPESSWFEGPSYPASSPHVVAVGGTRLTVTKPAGTWVSESVWNHGQGAGGGGCSLQFSAPLWQSENAGWPAVGCGARRAVADIAADADPATGVEVYDSVPEGAGIPEKEEPLEEAPEYITIGGTSVASPIIASVFALAGGAHGVAYPAATLYAHAGTAALHDVVAGGNGKCDGVYNNPTCTAASTPALDCGEGHTICNAASGYDGPTGVGTPIGLSGFQPVPGQIEGPSEAPHGSGGTGGSVAVPGGSSSAGAGGTGTPPSAAKTKAASRLRILGLSLTLGAVAALNRSRPALASVAFSFTLSAPVNVRVSLARRARVHGHWRWSTLRGSNSITAHAGLNQAHLRGRGRLPSGRYRLTLTPAHGIAGSIDIAIG
jgi:Subtilase family